MTTEITDKTVTRGLRGWVGYDGACPACRRGVVLLGPALRRRGFRPIPLQSASMKARLGLAAGEHPDEMKLVLPDGQILGGAGAALWLARRIWWLAPLGWLLWLPGLRWLTVRGYRRLARHRFCLGSACAVRRTPRHRTATFFEMP